MVWVVENVALVIDFCFNTTASGRVACIGTSVAIVPFSEGAEEGMKGGASARGLRQTGDVKGDCAGVAEALDWGSSVGSAGWRYLQVRGPNRQPTAKKGQICTGDSPPPFSSSPSPSSS